MSEPEESWWDVDAGPIVRSFARTGGRTRPTRDEFNLITLIIATNTDTARHGLEPEHIMILRMCTGNPLSVAEIAARLDMPATVAKVLLGDLLDMGAIHTRAPIALAEAPEIHVLQAVLDGIRRL
ncbi:DUF742 domain-containing protein [Streptomyces sp. NBS 14/10]|uniref:DUF742 domain-containing protein n=1 Tax=unclassified Streptomyces TaxID=2593676 RepID=UPI000B7E5F73|nr:DUF742 domain-containing protein [Streptomyces sp. NBS 14/10]KAK1183840.1 DUF742 domain-containing protein [Streptomyces sp. NBS 14/10]MDW6065448.1 DUF742 domain-containing protein [Streptomyces sp. FXJ1.4098]NUP42643.1 DUF742 domain-containing protein [Streptomyces sp.]NUS81301.1 DUF742 domain-containing protein [Streptomyces sp.]